MYATLYHHAQDAQPDMLPKISEDEDGRGEWLICVLIGGDRDSIVDHLAENSSNDQSGDETSGRMLSSVLEWRDGLEKEGALENVLFKIKMWKGDIFLSRF